VKLYFFGLHGSPKEILIPSENPVLIYQLRPGARSTFTYLNPDQTDWEYSVSINARGFRGPPYDGTSSRPRIVILGDSYAFGFGVDDDATFPHLLEELFRGEVDVLNWAVPAYNLVQQVELLREREGAYDPDVVVLAFHANDFEPPVFRDAGQVRRVLRSHLYAILLHLRFVAGEDIEVVLARDRSERVRHAESAFDALVAMSAARGFALYVFRVSCWSRYDQAAVERFLGRIPVRGIPVIDLDARFCIDLDTHSIPHDGHPTARGHAMLAEKLFAHLEPEVRRLLDRSGRSTRAVSALAGPHPGAAHGPVARTDDSCGPSNRDLGGAPALSRAPGFCEAPASGAPADPEASARAIRGRGSAAAQEACSGPGIARVAVPRRRACLEGDGACVGQRLWDCSCAAPRASAARAGAPRKARRPRQGRRRLPPRRHRPIRTCSRRSTAS
jgi:hypothetical protein